MSNPSVYANLRKENKVLLQRHQKGMHKLLWSPCKTELQEPKSRMGPTSEEIHEFEPQNKQPMVWKMVEHNQQGIPQQTDYNYHLR